MADPTIAAISGAVTALGTAAGSIFGSKQKAKLAEAETKKATVEGILALKQQQIAQQQEREKQRARQQITLFVVGALLLVLLIGGILFYKHSQKEAS